MRLICYSILHLLGAFALPSSVHGEQRPFRYPLKETAGTLHKFDLDHIDLDILAFAETHSLDVWHVSSSEAHIFIPSNQRADVDFEGLPNVLQNVPHEVSSIPPPSHYISTNTVSWNVSTLVNTTYHAAFHPLYEIDLFIRQLAEVFPDKVEVVELGHSATGREMLGLKVSSGSRRDQGLEGGNVGASKPPKKDKPGKERVLDPTKKLGFIITGAQHAREVSLSLRSL